MFSRFFIQSSFIITALIAKDAPQEKMKLLDAQSKEIPPTFSSSSLSHIGILSAKVDKKISFCTASHLSESSLTTEKECIETLKKGTSWQITYFNKSGKVVSENIALKAEHDGTTDLIHILLPESVRSNWPILPKVEDTEEKWFGGFHPEWELVRILGFMEGANSNTVQFQTNTCKLSKRSPELVYFSIDKEQESEELERIELAAPIAKNGKGFIEKCVRPMEAFSSGSLIVSSKTPYLVLGVLGKHDTTAPPLRVPATEYVGKELKKEYVGADGLLAPVPSSFPKISLWIATLFKSSN